MRVLIAHLDADVRRRVKEWITPFGFAVDEAAVADEVRATLRRTRHDVALVAINLCGERTPELLTDIKRGPYGHGVAVILLDQNIDYDAAMSQLRHGAHDFLVEPLNPAELVARVQAAVRVVSLQDELLGQTRRLEALVYQDALTGVHNRRFMLAQLAALISGARRHGRPVSVVMVDLDHFKAVNDTHGHAVGDAMLIAVARALRDRLRAEDYVGRMGGEEFLALLPDTGEHAAARVAESLRRCVGAAKVRTPAGEPVRLTASVGWATWAGEAPEELVRRADHALYGAKEAGRDLVRGG